MPYGVESEKPRVKCDRCGSTVQLSSLDKHKERLVCKHLAQCLREVESNSTES